MGDMFSGPASLFGIGPGQGEYFQAKNDNNSLGQLDNRGRASGNGKAAQLRNLFSQGKISQSELMDQLNGISDSTDGYSNQLMQDAQTDGLSGTRLATNAVQNNGILGQLFGEGGSLSRANSEEQDLSKRGFQLQPEDHEAYGQASGNIARMFGQSENNLSQSLANRGLSQADNGASAMSFSGLQGNKNEQLAKSQMDIANQRMQNNTQRLAQTRSYISQLGQQGANAIQGQYKNQLAGAGQTQDNLAKTAGLANQANGLYNESMQAQQKSKDASKRKTLGDAWASGTYSGIEQGTADSTKSWASMGGAGSMTGGGKG